MWFVWSNFVSFITLLCLVNRRQGLGYCWQVVNQTLVFASWSSLKTVVKRGPSAISAFCVLVGPQMFFSASSFGKVRKDSEMARKRALRYELLVAEDLRAEIRVASLEGILGTAALANSSRRVARRMVASDPRNAGARLEELEYLKRIHGEDGYHASWLWGLFSEAFRNCAVAAWVFLSKVISTRSERLCQDAFRVNGS